MARLSNIKVVYLQDIAYLKNEAKIRLLTKYITIIMEKEKQKLQDSKLNSSKFKKIAFKSAYLSSEEFI